MDISETPLAKEIDKHDDVYAFMQSVTQQRKKGTIKIKPDEEGVGRYRELVNAYHRRKKKAKDMNKSNKSVIEYFDTYLANRGGELNESTSNELLEEATLDLVYLTESVIEFVEGLKRGSAKTPYEVHQEINRRAKPKRKDNPPLGHPLTGDPVPGTGSQKKGWKRTKTAAKWAGIGAGALTALTTLGVGLGHLKTEDYNRGKDEEEHETPYQDHEKMRISQKLLNVKRGEDWKSREKKSKEQKRGKETGNKKYFDNLVTKIAVAKQPHAQKSLVSVSDRTAIPVTNKGLPGPKETANANIDAAMNADSISDSLRSGINNLKKNVARGKTKPKLGEYQANALLDMAKREKKIELRRGREERGQGRLFK